MMNRKKEGVTVGMRKEDRKKVGGTLLGKRAGKEVLSFR
jgi:hypothetical protein